MRYFIGLDLPVKEKLSLENWREKSLPQMPKITKKKPVKRTDAGPLFVPAANFHITLCFLGEATPLQLDSLGEAFDHIVVDRFELTLNSIGHWSGPNLFFVAPSEIPVMLETLAKQIKAAALNVGLHVEKRKFQPHVTVIRNALADSPPPLFTPAVTCSFDRFHLFESVTRQGGVYYPIRHTWMLNSGKTLREKLRKGLF